MTCDQWELAEAANTLAGDYRDLEVAKSYRTTRETRIMRPTPGPQPPTNTHLLSLQDQCERRLKEMVGECMQHLGSNSQAWANGTTLCTWLHHNAGPISQLPVAPDLLTELQDQHHTIRQTLNKTPPMKPDTPHPEPWQPASAIIALLAQQNIHITRQDLANWTHRKHITTRKKNNRTTYQLSQIIKHTKKTTQPTDNPQNPQKLDN